MSAQILRLPTKAKPDVDVIDTPFQRELQQVAFHLSDATTLDKGIEAIEAVLFHALSMRGCCNADLALYRELARRNKERG